MSTDLATIEFSNRQGERLDAAFHPGKPDRGLVILGHGVTGNKDRPLLVGVAEGLSALGWPCLRISFSGNGDSEGSFGEATVTKESEDLRDVLDQLPDDLKIAYCGHSMGAAVGLMTAAVDHRIRVVVNLAGMIRTEEFLEREFGDVEPDEGCMWDEPGCPLSRGYVDDMESIGDLLDEVGGLARPLLLIHGTADDVVLPEDSEEAFEAASEPKSLIRIEGAGHSFEESGYEPLVSAIHEWLGEHLR
ncbi:fermentation-respiration switch protein FrsA [Haloferula helveola]|uniref:Fermentation-respiration switch protein FrsA n=1 Tax=Haloferula helveola TaxID=490095 RepID=A0ABN6GZC8_9BACT|nr:fermentation-respiration switch protein FrsA [Haloferula helveola]